MVRAVVLFGMVFLSAHAVADELCEDAELSEAASSLLLDGETTPEGIRRAVLASGSDLPAVKSLRIRADDRRVAEAWLRDVRARADAPVACGEAQRDDVRLLLVSERAGGLREEGGRVRVWLEEGFGSPYLVFRGGDGEHQRVPILDESPWVDIPAELTPPILVQLLATGARGPRPVAERTLGGGADRVQLEMDGDNPWAALAALRNAHGASPVRRNRLLAVEAGAHAERVCRTATVGHVLADGQDPERRLAARGLSARVVGEVVARAEDLKGALSALTASPSHLVTMIDRRFTDAGVGQAHDGRGHTCIVMLFAAWPRPLVR